ncbi:MAG: ISNCY family transposase [Oceanicaulis sp.]
MSRKELDRAAVLDKLSDGRLTSGDAATLLDLSTRHVRRLQAAYRGGGAIALRSARRGAPSNRAYPAGFKDGVLSIIGAHYGDFGPTLAAEKLLERHAIAVSRETVRQWMTEAGYWIPRARRKTVHQLRPRRERFGELIQIDGSLHAWFEDRGPMCSLLVFIDDKIGRLVDLHFCPSESTFDYMIAAKRYVGRYGKPLAFYSDKHPIFRSAKESETGGANLTQFGRALSELNIDIRTERSRTGWSRRCGSPEYPTSPQRTRSLSDTATGTMRSSPLRRARPPTRTGPWRSTKISTTPSA